MADGRVTINVGTTATATGESVELLAERAVYWPTATTLIVADLHWGKDATFRQFGVPIPAGVLGDDLQTLATALQKTGASRLVIVGDLIHAKAGMTPSIVADVAAWRARWDALEMVLVRGNHDRHVPVLPAQWRIIVHPEPILRDGPFAFVHEPADVPGHFAWAGHIHPAITLRGRADALRLPCFRIGRSVGILPAFSAFTGGLQTPRTADDRVFVVAPPHIVAV